MSIEALTYIYKKKKGVLEDMIKIFGLKTIRKIYDNDMFTIYKDKHSITYWKITKKGKNYISPLVPYKKFTLLEKIQNKINGFIQTKDLKI